MHTYIPVHTSSGAAAGSSLAQGRLVFRSLRNSTSRKFAMPQTRPSDADYQVMRDGSDHGELSAAEIRNRFSQQYHGEPRWVLSPSGGEHLYHQGGIGKARRSKLSTVAGYIIVTEFCERLAYFGLSGSLVLLFEKELGMTNVEADTQFAIWSGVCYVTPLFGGWIADSYFGRYNSILIFSFIYLAGLFVAAASCVPGSVSPLLLFPAIYVLALGTGGIKASVSVFGADQFDDNDPADVEEKRSFFNWFYWSINLGAVVSFTLVSYVCQYGLPFLGGPDWGFMAGYAIPCIAMSVAVVFFLAGAPTYRRYPPSGSVIGRAVGVVVEAAWTRRRVAFRSGGVTGGREGIQRGGVGEGQPEWLQKASERSGGSYPHDEVVAVSRVWRLLPFLALQVPFWAVYSQMATAFQNQGCQMELSLLGANIPVSTLNVFDSVAVLLLIPFADGFVFPWMRRAGCEPTMLRKMGAGLMLAAVAVLVAAAVEVRRRDGVAYGDGAVVSPCRRASDYDPAQFQDFWNTRNASSEPADRPAFCRQVPGCTEIGSDGMLLLDCIDCDSPPLASTLSVLWQVPQYLLIGASEILLAVTSLEFFYAEAPTTVRGVSAGLNLLTTALGSWMTVPLLTLVNSGAFGGAWVPGDLNNGHLELYFCLLAGLVAASLVAFVVFAKSYHYQGVTDGSPTVLLGGSLDSSGNDESGAYGDASARGGGGVSDPGDGGQGYGGGRGEPGGRRSVSWDEGSQLLSAGAGGGLAGQSDSPTFGQI